jgi:thiamine-monophosphate kinase
MSMSETVKEAGEFGLIRRIQGLLKKEGPPPPLALSVPMGDDAAAFKPRLGHEILVTCDSVVENRHFLPRLMSPRDIGRRSMVMNISDIGAMGGRPRYALISLGLKEETPVEDVEEIYRGFLDELTPFGAAIIGGNLTRTVNDLFIDITLIGEILEGRMVRRSTARPGDVILVTGYPGRSAAGLELLLRSLVSVEHPLARAYLRPSHRAREGASIGETGQATAMIDTSDGFLGDLGHLCEESGVGAELFPQRFPADENLRNAAALLDKDLHECFLGASDDYELIITCAADGVAAVRAAVSASYNGPVSKVGRITPPGTGICLVASDGSKKIVTAQGWDHYV